MQALQPVLKGKRAQSKIIINAKSLNAGGGRKRVLGKKPVVLAKRGDANMERALVASGPNEARASRGGVKVVA